MADQEGTPNQPPKVSPKEWEEQTRKLAGSIDLETERVFLAGGDADNYRKIKELVNKGKPAEAEALSRAFFGDTSASDLATAINERGSASKTE
ncbi:MAG: hypothetical protein WC640_00490 [Candidatus Paceibacterota bacterium]|jgi:hypothetical protein